MHKIRRIVASSKTAALAGRSGSFGCAPFNIGHGVAVALLRAGAELVGRVAVGEFFGRRVEIEPWAE